MVRKKGMVDKNGLRTPFRSKQKDRSVLPRFIVTRCIITFGGYYPYPSPKEYAPNPDEEFRGLLRSQTQEWEGWKYLDWMKTQYKYTSHNPLWGPKLQYNRLYLEVDALCEMVYRWYKKKHFDVVTKGIKWSFDDIHLLHILTYMAIHISNKKAVKYLQQALKVDMGYQVDITGEMDAQTVSIVRKMKDTKPLANFLCQYGVMYFERETDTWFTEKHIIMLKGLAEQYRLH